MTQERLDAVREKIREACQLAGRAEKDVLLIGVSKTKSAEEVAVLAALGVRDFGENYVQEALGKVNAMPELRWHFIGSLQSNKAKFLPGNFTLFHALDSFTLAQKLDKAAAAKGLVLPALVEVNVDAEGSKAGVADAQLARLLEQLTTLPHLEIRGLMCIPAPTNEKRRPFASLRGLLEAVNREGAYRLPLRELSMGMSHDYPEAILEGATMIRVGTALFGERK